MSASGAFGPEPEPEDDHVRGSGDSASGTVGVTRPASPDDASTRPHRLSGRGSSGARGTAGGSVHQDWSRDSLPSQPRLTDLDWGWDQRTTRGTIDEFDNEPFAREYVDDESKDPCTKCPPTCEASIRFAKNFLRGLFPFGYLIELMWRYYGRMFIHSCAKPDSCCNMTFVKCCKAACPCSSKHCKPCPCYWDRTGASTSTLQQGLLRPISEQSSESSDCEDDDPRAAAHASDSPQNRRIRVVTQEERQRTHCCERCFHKPARGSKWAANDKLVTTRRMAECLASLYYLALVYAILCRSANFHYKVNELLRWLGMDAMVPLILPLFGTDPWNANVPGSDDDAYLDPALSVMFYPVFAFLLLVTLHAHEETSYPRRLRIEYSVETDSILAIVVKLVSKMAHDPNDTQDHRTWKQQIRSSVLACTSSALIVIGTQILTLQFSFNWLEKWEHKDSPAALPWVGASLVLLSVVVFIVAMKCTQPHVDVDHSAKPTCVTLYLVPRLATLFVCMLSLILGLELLLISLNQTNVPAGSQEENEAVYSWLGQFRLIFFFVALVSLSSGLMMLRLVNRDLRREKGFEPSELRKNDLVEIGSERHKGKIGRITGVPGKILRERPLGSVRSFHSSPFQRGAKIPLTDHEGGQMKECTCTENHWGRKSPGVDCATCCGFQNHRERHGTARVFKVPNDCCVVRIDTSHANDLAQLTDVDRASEKQQERLIVVKLNEIADVGWATRFRDIWADITGRELRKLSYESEKYSERYNRRFRELQCTPIVNYHFQRFEKSSLDQLEERFFQFQLKAERPGSSPRDGSADDKYEETREAIIDMIAVALENHKIQRVSGVSTTEDDPENLSNIRAEDRDGTNSKKLLNRVSKLQPGDRRQKLSEQADRDLLDAARRIDGFRLRDLLREKIDEGRGITSGLFFQYFDGSLIFNKRSKAVSMTASCIKSCIVGMVLGALWEDKGSLVKQLRNSDMNITDTQEFNWAVWIGLCVGLLIGAAIGIADSDKDPTANHLGGHILTLQHETQLATQPDPVTGNARPVCADSVGRMIIYLSKARQYKQRQLWRGRLWYISIAHASIPFAYTFILTQPRYAGYLTAYAFLGLVVSACLRTYDVEDVESKRKVSNIFAKIFMAVFVGIPIIVLMLGLPGVRSALPIVDNLPDNVLMHFKTLDKRDTDVCEPVLDTQGHCCCDNSQRLVDAIEQERLLKDSSWGGRQPRVWPSIFLDGNKCHGSNIQDCEFDSWLLLTAAGADRVDKYRSSNNIEYPTKRWIDEIAPKLGRSCSLPCGKDTDEFKVCRREADGRDDGNSGCKEGKDNDKVRLGCFCMNSQDDCAKCPTDDIVEICTHYCSEFGYCGEGEKYKYNETHTGPRRATNCTSCAHFNQYEDNGCKMKDCVTSGERVCRPNDSRYACDGGSPCQSYKPDTTVCFDQVWLEETDWGDTKHGSKFVELRGGALPSDSIEPTIHDWCNASAPNPDGTPRCHYRVAETNQTACQVPLWIAFDPLNGLGCLACGGTVTVHFLTFWANAALTFALVCRLYRCFEDYYVQYHRMLYFLQLTPWSTMKHVYKDLHSNDVRQKHEHWGLLPTFDLDSSVNIVAWNKLRLFLQTYEQRASRRLQVSVTYLLVAWVMICVYQATKAVARRGHEVLDIETVFVISSTVMLAAGLAAILFTGKWINDITQTGFPHVLRVKQAELLDKTSHYLVEHDFWNGSFIHKSTDAHSRTCTHPACTQAYAHVHAVSTGHARADTFSVEQLQTLKISEVRAYSVARGVAAGVVDEAMNSDDPKARLIGSIEELEAAEAQREQQLREELENQPRTTLEIRALDEGVPQSLLDYHGDRENVDGKHDAGTTKTKFIDLIVEYTHKRRHPLYDDADVGLLKSIEQKAKARGIQSQRDIDLETHLKQPVRVGRSISTQVTDGVTFRPQSPATTHVAAPPLTYEWLEARLNSPLGRSEDHQAVTHCYRLLETLIGTVYDEYRVGSRSHWGAEDRRTKLWFIVMGQNTIRGFAAALVSGLLPIVLRVVIDGMIYFDP